MWLAAATELENIFLLGIGLLEDPLEFLDSLRIGVSNH